MFDNISTKNIISQHTPTFSLPHAPPFLFQFWQWNRNVVRFHQFHKTGFSFTNGSCRFTETDL